MRFLIIFLLIFIFGCSNKSQNFSPTSTNEEEKKEQTNQNVNQYDYLKGSEQNKYF